MEKNQEAGKGGVVGPRTNLAVLDSPLVCARYVAYMHRYLRSMDDISPNKNYAATSAAPNNTDYTADIRHYLRSIETNPIWRPTVLEKDVVTAREDVLLSLMDIAEHHNLLHETRFLAISYMDRSLSSPHVFPGLPDEQQLDLLGMSCLFLAIKYEGNRISLGNICGTPELWYTHTKEEVLEMEKRVLKALHYEMGNPTVRTFLTDFTESLAGDRYMSLLVDYLADCSLFGYNCYVQFLPSVIAASVIFIAKFMIDPRIDCWSSALQRHTGYAPADLKACVRAIHGVHMKVIQSRFPELKLG